MRGRKKGTPKTGGRHKGTPNKTTAAAKEAIALAFDGIGGVPELVEWAKENRTEFYKLYARLIPVDVTASGDLTLKIVDLTGRNATP